MAYKNIPVDDETYERIQALCAVYEMGKRAQGALVKKLVNKDYAALAAVNLLPVPVKEVADGALKPIVE